MRACRLALVTIGLLFVCNWLLPLRHFNPFTGSYIYDPRNDGPSIFIAAPRPDQRLLDVLNRQITRNGTYPPGASLKAVGVELTRVQMELYTDWYPATEVRAMIKYADGSSRTIDFEFTGAGGVGIGPLATANYYPRLSLCREVTTTTSYCEQGIGSP